MTAHQPTDPSCRDNSSMTVRKLSGSTSAPPRSCGTHMRNKPAACIASTSAGGRVRSRSNRSRNVSTRGARPRAAARYAVISALLIQLRGVVQKEVAALLLGQRHRQDHVGIVIIPV